MTSPTPRLTPEQAAATDALARCWLTYEEGGGTSVNPTHARILDLLDERTALVARAEQAERDRDTLAAEVRQNRASERILLAAALAAGQTNERTAKATDASGALDRAAKGGA